MIYYYYVIFVNSRDLHVIELIDTGNASRPTIELVIRPAMVRRLRRNLMLVLKSHCSALWIIETRGLRGTLDIVVSARGFLSMQW